MGDEDAVTILDAITGDVIHVAPGPHVSSFVTRTAPIRRPDAAVGRRGGGRMEVIEVLPLVPVARDIPVASRRREGKAAEEEMFASGFATEEGMAGVVYEQQTITATTDTTGTFCLGLSTASEQSKPSCVRANVRDGDVATGVELEAALAKIGAEVKVTVSDGGGSNNRGHEWTITFLSSSDAANLAVNVSGLTSGKVTVVERVKGHANEFSISPRTDDGSTLTNGDDTFFSELDKVDENGDFNWESDGGVASLDSVVYEKQRIFIPAGSTGRFCLKLTYDHWTYVINDGFKCFDVDRGADALKAGFQRNRDIGPVDVVYTHEGRDDAFVYDVTFRGLLGNLPLLEEYVPDVFGLSLSIAGNSLSPRLMEISEIFAGKAKAPGKDVASDGPCVRENQRVTLVAEDASRALVEPTHTVLDAIVAEYSTSTGSSTDTVAWNVDPINKLQVSTGSPTAPTSTAKKIQSGRTSFRGRYQATSTGESQVSVPQPVRGGLTCTFWDNPWLLGAPVFHRVDPEVSFNWGTGDVEGAGKDHVSTEWRGKLLAPVTETFVLFVRADSATRLYVDHKLIIDAWKGHLRGSKEHVAKVDLTQGTYHDIALLYREDRGAAHIQLMWSSQSTPPAVVPPSALLYGTPISASPYDIFVGEGGAVYPYTDAYGDGVSSPVAPEPAETTGRAKDTPKPLVTIAGGDVSTGANGPIVITAAEGLASQSAVRSDLVSFQGVPHYHHAVQSTYWFEDHVHSRTGYAGFDMSPVVSSDARSGAPSLNLLGTAEVVSRGPDVRGDLIKGFAPDVAGYHRTTQTFTGPEGLITIVLKNVGSTGWISPHAMDTTQAPYHIVSFPSTAQPCDCSSSVFDPTPNSGAPSPCLPWPRFNHLSESSSSPRSKGLIEAAASGTALFCRTGASCLHFAVVRCISFPCTTGCSCSVLWGTISWGEDVTYFMTLAIVLRIEDNTYVVAAELSNLWTRTSMRLRSFPDGIAYDFVVFFQGVPYYHCAVEPTYWFEDLVHSRPGFAGFDISLVISPDARFGASSPKRLGTAEVLSRRPDVRGDLIEVFMPDVAGYCGMANTFTGPGGLLATALKNVGPTGWISPDEMKTTQELYHEVVPFPGTAQLCDCTSLVFDPTLNSGAQDPCLAWPLFDQLSESLSSPRPEGFIAAAASGTAVFCTTGARCLHFAVDRCIFFPCTTGCSCSVLWGTISWGEDVTYFMTLAKVLMIEDNTHAVAAELSDLSTRTSMTLRWLPDGVAYNTVFYTRQVEGSTVEQPVSTRDVDAYKLVPSGDAFKSYGARLSENTRVGSPGAEDRAGSKPFGQKRSDHGFLATRMVEADEDIVASSAASELVMVVASFILMILLAWVFIPAFHNMGSAPQADSQHGSDDRVCTARSGNIVFHRSDDGRRDYDHNMVGNSTIASRRYTGGHTEVSGNDVTGTSSIEEEAPSTGEDTGGDDACPGGVETGGVDAGEDGSGIGGQGRGTKPPTGDANTSIGSTGPNIGSTSTKQDVNSSSSGNAVDTGNAGGSGNVFGGGDTEDSSPGVDAADGSDRKPTADDTASTRCAGQEGAASIGVDIDSGASGINSNEVSGSDSDTAGSGVGPLCGTAEPPPMGGNASVGTTGSNGGAEHTSEAASKDEASSKDIEAGAASDASVSSSGGSVFDIASTPSRGLSNHCYVHGRTVCLQRCFLNTCVQIIASVPRLRACVLGYAKGNGVPDIEKNGALAPSIKVVRELAGVLEDIPQAQGQQQEPLDISSLETAVRELLPKPWNRIEGREVDPMGLSNRIQHDTADGMAVIVGALNAVFPSQKYGAGERAKEMGFVYSGVQTTHQCEFCEKTSATLSPNWNIAVPIIPLKNHEKVWNCEEDVKQAKEKSGKRRKTAIRAAEKRLSLARTEQDQELRNILEGETTEVQHNLNKLFGVWEKLPDARCMYCGAREQRKMQEKLVEAPEVLILTLNRYDQKMHNKVTREVTFPFDDLEVSISEATDDTGGDHPVSLRTVRYMATSVARHLGQSAAGGHNMAVVRKSTAADSDWWSYNDHIVCTIPYTEAIKDAQTIVYRRSDSIQA